MIENLSLLSSQNIYDIENKIDAALDSLSEILLLNKENNPNQNNDNKDAIKYFCDQKIIEAIISITKYHNKDINLKIIKYLSIIISNSENIILKNDNLNKYNFFDYLCDKGYINQIIINLSNIQEKQDDDFLSYYINFLKTISNKININSIKLIFHLEYNKFPLLDKILILLNNDDIMIRNSARNIFLALIKLNYIPLIEYLCDIPRITIFIFIAQKIKTNVLLMISLKNNDNKFYLEKTKELKEKIIEDLLFVQDILSIKIEKINYILINCLFSILFLYIFGKIISFSNNPNDTEIKSEISKSINILRIILKNIKNESIKNIICYLIFSEKFYSKINKYLTNIDKCAKKEFNIENLRLLNLNYKNFNYNFTNLQFEDYIILNYSEVFMKSFRYINNLYVNQSEFKNEIKEIYNYLVKYNENNDVENCTNIFNNKYFNNKRQSIIRMYNYHYFISKRTGINCGICHDGDKDSLCNIIYNNFLLIQSYIIKNNNINNYYQNNLLRKGILIFLGNEIENNNTNINIILNIVLLLLKIIHDNNISDSLKKLMNIINKQNKNTNSINKEKNNSYIDNINIDKDDDIYKPLIYPESLPYPNKRLNFLNIKSDNNEDNDFKYILINEQKVNFTKLNFNKNFFIEFNLSNNSNIINNNNEIIINIINFLFSNKFKINNNNIILCFNLIVNLGCESVKLNNNQNYGQISDIINYYYINTLKQINDILFKNNNDLKNEIFKYSYSLFEESYNLYQKDIKEIINNYYSELQSSYIIIDSSQVSEEKTLLKNLFQKFICLHDIKLLIKHSDNKNDNLSNLLFKNSPFPLKLIKNDCLEIGGKINLKEFDINSVELLLIKNYDKNKNYLNLIKEPLVMFVYNNYLFFSLSPENVGSYDINSIDDEELSFIKYKFAIRDIISIQDINNNQLFMRLKGKSSVNKILLKFDNNILFNKGKDLLVNGVNNSILLEYSSISSFINKYLGESYKNSK